MHSSAVHPKAKCVSLITNMCFYSRTTMVLWVIVNKCMAWHFCTHSVIDKYSWFCHQDLWVIPWEINKNNWKNTQSHNVKVSEKKFLDPSLLLRSIPKVNGVCSRLEPILIQVSWKSVDRSLCNPAEKQMNKRTGVENRTSLLEVKTENFARFLHWTIKRYILCRVLCKNICIISYFHSSVLIKAFHQYY